MFETAGSNVLTASTGIVSGVGGNTHGRVQVSGMNLGLHTVTITFNSGVTVYGDTLDIITPIHSAKSNIYSDLQNTLPVGSQAISDNRKTSPIKDAPLQRKSISQALAVTSGPTTSSTTAVPLADMSVTHQNTSGRIMINYACVTTQSTGNASYLQAYVDGVAVGSIKTSYVQGTNTSLCDIMDSLVVFVSPGIHKVDVYWYQSAGTGTAINNWRNLTVIEL